MEKIKKFLSCQDSINIYLVHRKVAKWSTERRQLTAIFRRSWNSLGANNWKRRHFSSQSTTKCRAFRTNGRLFAKTSRKSAQKLAIFATNLCLHHSTICTNNYVDRFPIRNQAKRLESSSVNVAPEAFHAEMSWKVTKVTALESTCWLEQMDFSVKGATKKAGLTRKPSNTSLRSILKLLDL